MDNLADLPIEDDEQELNPVQQQLMEKYIGVSSVATGGDGDKWKYIGYAVAVFLILMNPWVQGMLDKAPYLGGNNLKVLALSAVLFTIAMIVANFFL